MDQIAQLQEDIHKLKKVVDGIFEKIESDKCSAADVYADKDKAIEMINRLCTKMGESDMLDLTTSPAKDIGADVVQELKEKIVKLQSERMSLHRRTEACVKGLF
ncbi:hypothetical protein SDRG_10593 [Saprolegnia diclina VS20]|uniref:Uncharacterized protein n=1 Tax=Saprolegnia diclina (strain VS20) TaxID=1156394 RepID=T0Q1S9_SAPDV|nr:hypothetical protein SDRG_10593 [Saprolegnia diclina VS20]EQC31804.1 hypothetical protein SDRG_10593 [Saprolegnia diclina VS20]|eukprot:XP_008614811.1 hypothetical protein SDRG_10593 [Saprolegnia diclina VS20]